jgi:hypothetical protein
MFQVRHVTNERFSFREDTTLASSSIPDQYHYLRILEAYGMLTQALAEAGKAHRDCPGCDLCRAVEAQQGVVSLFRDKFKKVKLASMREATEEATCRSGRPVQVLARPQDGP